jgi:hypothetical protein
MTDLVLKLTGLPQLQKTNKNAVGIAFGHDLVEAAMTGVKPKGADLQFLGITDEMWERIAGEARTHGYRDGPDGLWDPNTALWGSAEAAAAAENALIKHVNSAVITPNDMEKPLLMTQGVLGELGKSTLQFMAFPMSAMHKMVVPNIQGPAAKTYMEMAAMYSTGIMIYYTRQFAKGEPPSTDYNKVAWEAMNSSGLVAYGTDLYNRVARLTGADPMGVLPSRYFARSPLEVMAGPSGGTATTVARAGRAFFNNDPDTLMHSLRMLTPAQNHWAINRLFDKVEGGAAQMIGGTGRFAEPRVELTAPRVETLQ